MKTKLVETLPHLRLISKEQDLILDPTDGTETIAEAKDTFLLGIDPTFARPNWNTQSSPTDTQPVYIYGVSKEGTFSQIFSDRENMCLTQAQIVQFTTKYPRCLQGIENLNFILFKSGSQFGVARIYNRRGTERVGIAFYDFVTYPDIYLWNPGYNVLIPHN